MKLLALLLIFVLLLTGCTIELTRIDGQPEAVDLSGEYLLTISTPEEEEEIPTSNSTELHGARLTRDTTPTVEPLVLTYPTFNVELYDFGDLHAEGDSKFVIKDSGVYVICASVSWERYPLGRRLLEIRWNGRAPDGFPLIVTTDFMDGNAETSYQTVSTVAYLETGDTLEVMLRQSGPVAIDILNTPCTSPIFAIQRIR